MIVGHTQFNDRQRARLAGARQALEEAGLSLPDPLVVEQSLTLAGGRAGCAMLLDLEDRPTALIGGIDVFAIGCLEEAHARGMAVPEDLSVIGIDGLDMSAHVSPGLTTVHVPTGRIGNLAARTLMAMVAGQPVEPQQLLPVELVVRRSCRRLAAS